MSVVENAQVVSSKVLNADPADEALPLLRTGIVRNSDAGRSVPPYPPAPCARSTSWFLTVLPSPPIEERRSNEGSSVARSSPCQSATTRSPAGIRDRRRRRDAS